MDGTYAALESMLVRGVPVLANYRPLFPACECHYCLCSLVSMYGVGLENLLFSWRCQFRKVPIVVGMIQELIDAHSSKEGTCKKSGAEIAFLKTRIHSSREALQELRQ